MALRFNPPPGWPAVPPGWTPPRGWTPPEGVPEPPQDWPMWVETTPGRTWFARHRLLTAAAVLALLVGGWTVADGDDADTSTIVWSTQAG